MWFNDSTKGKILKKIVLFFSLMGALPVYSGSGYTKTVIVYIMGYELTSNVTLIHTTLGSAINNVYIPVGRQLRSSFKEESSVEERLWSDGWPLSRLSIQPKSWNPVIINVKTKQTDKYHDHSRPSIYKLPPLLISVRKIQSVIATG